MSYATLQKDLELITLKKDLDQALERMVDFEEEVNRTEEEEESDSEEEEEEESDYEEVEERRRDIFVRVSKGYLLGVAVGYSLAKIFSYINGGSKASRDKNNQR